MIYWISLMILQVAQSLSVEDAFIPDNIAERDGYTVGYHTFRYNTSSADRYVRDVASSRYRTDFSRQEISEIVDYHNRVRTQVQPSASNMQYMEWDEQLAHMAQQWAENCDFQHGQIRNLSPYRVVGQNMFAGSGDVKYKSGVFASQKWFEEEQWYDYETSLCVPGEMCGHYTQMAWRNSNKFGCGRQECRRLRRYGGDQSAYLIVCNYGPTGNYNGQKPYSVGPACTQCPTDKPWCYNGLCHDCSPNDSDCECRKRCKNCGTLDETRCNCNCMDGWMGPDCSTPCEDTHEWCGANPGWPSIDFCHVFSYVPERCPKFCGVCNPASKSTTCDSKSHKRLPVTTAGKEPRKKPSVSNKKRPKKPKSPKPFYCSQIPYAVSMIDNEIVMFKKGKMWRFTSTGRLLSDANGDYVQSNYRGVANGFKAVYQRQHDNRVVFLRGADFYIFNGNTLESGPTKLKSVGLKGNPSAAFYHRGERKSYYFKGSTVWRFDDRRQRVDPGFPKPITDVFQGVPPKITGAFQDVRGDLIFLQGKGYYKVNLGSSRVTGGRKLFHREIIMEIIKGC